MNYLSDLGFLSRQVQVFKFLCLYRTAQHSLHRLPVFSEGHTDVGLEGYDRLRSFTPIPLEVVTA